MLNKNTLSLLVALSVLFFACEEKTFDPVVELVTAPELTAPTTGTGFVLAEDAVEQNLTTFTWTAADFGYSAGITYRIEFDIVGNNFAEAITLGSSNDLSFTNLSIGKMNNILLAKGLPFGFDNELEVRVCASVSTQVETMCSEPITITVNPFAAEVEYPFLTVPGDYQGWNPADESRAIFSRRSDDIYTGFIYFPIDNAVYKFVQGLSWDVNWGDIELDGVLDPQGIGNDIMIPDGAGMYLLTCDLNTLTHAAQKTNWGLLGDATPNGWDNDVDFEWDTEREVLSITLDLNPGSIKFRANDTDDISFGDDFTNGTLEFDGDNIPITEAGNYTIDLILMTADYSYTITKN